ncbi:hypothetical protein EDB82DRAFT_140391 [Fusarium venenatum]|uniref:uncharacterized protein n=1 Tax=Fusarium venenatum TaxID=56646 RepID=UPI001D81F50B|nr:hypothetical protein EDB82DRAFT_140391 [Fusarium venenatum]
MSWILRQTQATRVILLITCGSSSPLAYHPGAFALTVVYVCYRVQSTTKLIKSTVADKHGQQPKTVVGQTTSTSVVHG